MISRHPSEGAADAADDRDEWFTEGWADERRWLARRQKEKAS